MKLENLQNEIIKFRNERNWKQFHKIKDLILGLNIEASELAELFLWKNDEEINAIEQGKIEEAIQHDRKASRSLARRQADLERGQEQKVVFKRHNHDKLAWLATHRPHL